MVLFVIGIICLVALIIWTMWPEPIQHTEPVTPVYQSEEEKFREALDANPLPISIEEKAAIKATKPKKPRKPKTAPKPNPKPNK